MVCDSCGVYKSKKVKFFLYIFEEGENEKDAVLSFLLK